MIEKLVGLIEVNCAVTKIPTEIPSWLVEFGVRLRGWDSWASCIVHKFSSLTYANKQAKRLKIISVVNEEYYGKTVIIKMHIFSYRLFYVYV